MTPLLTEQLQHEHSIMEQVPDWILELKYHLFLIVIFI